VALQAGRLRGQGKFEVAYFLGFSFVAAFSARWVGFWQYERRKQGRMKHGTAIEWTHLPGYRGETWNPHGGCTKVSAGCQNCFALRQAVRFQRLPQYEGTVKGGNWTGRVNIAPDPQFYKPLGWRDPRAIFVCSMSDFFHPGADEWREWAWHTIYDTPHHLYLILTKRPERIPDCLPDFGKKEWPWPHVWLGASVENNDNRQRVEDLLKVRAAKRFLSLEPLLGPVDLSKWLCKDAEGVSAFTGEKVSFRCGIRQVIVGGESGPGARPMEAKWAESILRQCREAGVPFFMKQMAKKAPIPERLMVREFPRDRNFSSIL